MSFELQRGVCAGSLGALVLLLLSKISSFGKSVPLLPGGWWPLVFITESWLYFFLLIAFRFLFTKTKCSCVGFVGFDIHRYRYRYGVRQRQ